MSNKKGFLELSKIERLARLGVKVIRDNLNNNQRKNLEESLRQRGYRVENCSIVPRNPALDHPLNTYGEPKAIGWLGPNYIGTFYESSYFQKYNNELRKIAESI